MKFHRVGHNGLYGVYLRLPSAHERVSNENPRENILSRYFLSYFIECKALAVETYEGRYLSIVSSRLYSYPSYVGVLQLQVD